MPPKWPSAEHHQSRAVSLRPGSSGRIPGTAGLASAGGQSTPAWLGLSALGVGKAAGGAKILHLPDAAAAGLRRVWDLTAIACPAEPGAFVVQAGPRRYTGGDVPGPIRVGTG